MEGGQFQGVLVGFGSGVAEEEGVVVIAAGPAYPVRQFLLKGILHGVGVEAESGKLFRNHSDVMRVTVPDGYHGMASVHVGIFVAVLVPEGGVYPSDGLDVP